MEIGLQPILEFRKEWEADTDRLNCMLCEKDIRDTSDRRRCNFCGRIYHAKCYDQQKIRLKMSTDTFVLLWPERRLEVIGILRKIKEDATARYDDGSRSAVRNKLAVVSDDEIIAGTLFTVRCKFCADETRRRGPGVAENLEATGRYDDAAAIYDEIGLLQKARRVRKRALSRGKEE